jgi:hypothetical protein
VITRLLLVLFVLAPVMLAGGRSAAQQADAASRFDQLHERAVEAYSDLEIDQAVDLLEEALSLAEREGLAPELVAPVRLTYATVLILGLNRLADGRAQMVLAINEDATATPPRELSTDVVLQLWDDVRSEHGSTVVAPPPVETEPEEVVQFHQARVNVMRVDEQLVQHAIPIFVEVEQVEDIGRVLLSYRGPGMRQFLRIEMQEHETGYAGRIVCHRVEEPEVEYFVEVLDSEGQTVVTAGSADEPRRVAVRRELEGAPPHLPGAPAEPPCAEDSREEVPVRGEARARIMFFSVGVGTGAGVPYRGEPLELHCPTALDNDAITIQPALSWTELVLLPEIGVHIGPSVALSVRGRLQVPGAVYPNAPFAWAVLGRVAWFVLPRDPYRLALHLAGGYGSVNQPITLKVQDPLNCPQYYDESATGGVIYHRLAGAGIVQIGTQFLWDLHRNFAIGAEIDISVLFPEFAVQGDLLLMVNASF